MARGPEALRGGTADDCPAPIREESRAPVDIVGASNAGLVVRRRAAGPLVNRQPDSAPGPTTPGAAGCESAGGRSVCRAVLLTPDREILLIRVREPTTGWTAWITPGGGAAAGESPRDTLRRELFEETGLRDFELGPVVWTRDHSGTWEGRAFRQVEAFYLIRIARFAPTLSHQPEATEVRAFQGFRWWPIGEILQSDDTFVPRRLGWYLRDLAGQTEPPPPFDAGE